jgi:hypothetical protein
MERVLNPRVDQMKVTTIKTDAGDLTLYPAEVDQLRGIARYWPMELICGPETPGRYRLVFQHGAEEVHGVKMQLPDLPRGEAIMNCNLYRILIAAALRYYLEKQHRGILVPCAYIKEKGPDSAEAGIAFFVGPDPASKSTTGERKPFLDDRLGDGATEMVLDMMNAIAHALTEYQLPSMTLLGLDVRPRLALGSISLDFVVEGSQVIVVKDRQIENHFIWEYVVRAGFTDLPYAPMTPIALDQSLPADARRI